MSDAKQGRFEIDLDEIERQLRRSSEAAPPPKNDPLAELARIVGQDDPFSGLFAKPKADAASSEQRTSARPASPAPNDADIDVYAHEEEAVLAEQGAAKPFDPVVDAYGSHDAAFADEDFQPLTPRRSRRNLLGVTVAILAVVGAGTAFFAWRNGSVKFASNGAAPPVIKADSTPLKVAPENPGGMEIPNQDRQIYQRSQPEGRARIVDRQEQPIDVQEAARTLPPAPTQAPAPVVVPSAPSGSANPGTVASPGAASPSAVPPGAAPSGATANPSGARPPRPNAVHAALGEPRRVRTVVVRPDGTVLGGPSLASADPTVATPPGIGSLPPPIPVQTVPVSANGREATPAASTPAAPSDSGATPSGNAVSVLPPQRPRLAATEARPSANTPAPQPSVSSPSNGFTVQLGVRGTEQEARTAFNQAQSRYASELSGRSPVLAKAEVGGKTVYRVRVGASSKADATGLCDRLKVAGAQCYVASP